MEPQWMGGHVRRYSRIRLNLFVHSVLLLTSTPYPAGEHFAEIGDLVVHERQTQAKIEAALELLQVLLCQATLHSNRAAAGGDRRLVHHGKL